MAEKQQEDIFEMRKKKVRRNAFYGFLAGAALIAGGITYSFTASNPYQVNNPEFFQNRARIINSINAIDDYRESVKQLSKLELSKEMKQRITYDLENIAGLDELKQSLTTNLTEIDNNLIYKNCKRYMTKQWGILDGLMLGGIGLLLGNMIYKDIKISKILREQSENTQKSS